MRHRWLGFACFLSLFSSAAFAEVVWRGDFETGNLSQWSIVQQVSSDRLTVVQSPTNQGKYALKVVLKQGDDPINASGNRNELAMGNELEKEGSEFYYRWSTMFAQDYPSANTWQVFTQWHHDGCCGSPPLEFDVQGEKIMLISGPSETVLWSAPLVRGAWQDFIFHVKWSADSEVGFVELYYNGKLVLPKRFVATGANTYLKQGLYRDAAVSADGVVYHDGMVQGTALEDVWPTSSPLPTGTASGDGGTPDGSLSRSSHASDTPAALVSAHNGCSNGTATALAPVGLGIFGGSTFRKRRKKY